MGSFLDRVVRTKSFKILDVIFFSCIYLANCDAVKFLFVTFTWTYCSALMDCVGCEKCRLWGKLQVLGLGTALKILFSVDGQNQPEQPVSIICYRFFIFKI